MIRFLIRLVIWFLAAFIGIIAADLLLSGFSVSGWTSYVVVAAIYAWFCCSTSLRIAPHLRRGDHPRRQHGLATGPVHREHRVHERCLALVADPEQRRRRAAGRPSASRPRRARALDARCSRAAAA